MPTGCLWNHTEAPVHRPRRALCSRLLSRLKAKTVRATLPAILPVALGTPDLCYHDPRFE